MLKLFTEEQVDREIAAIGWPISCPLCKEQAVIAKKSDAPHLYVPYYWLRCDECWAATDFHTSIEWRGVVKERKAMEPHTEED